MKKMNYNFKKGLALLLAFVMAVGILPSIPGRVEEIQAADAVSTGGIGTPSVTAYATPEQLMTEFTPDENGKSDTIGKLVFGKNGSGESRQWYILGRDNGVSGDNTIIFPIGDIATGQVFNSSTDNKAFDSKFGVYAANPSEVYPTHYGASELRAMLQNMAVDEKYFSKAEQGLMNPTTVTSNDAMNNISYTNTDILYVPYREGKENCLRVGSDDSIYVNRSCYWNNGDKFWMRTWLLDMDMNEFMLCLNPDENTSDVDMDVVDRGHSVRAASNLNLSSVHFASAATAASSDAAVSGTIASGTAMKLRLDGTGKNIGLVTYNTTTGDIKVTKGTTSQTVALVVQGNDGTSDWYYSKKINTSGTINVADIRSALNLSSDIDLSVCKIWLEITDTDGLIYAEGATEVLSITSVEITGIETPASNITLDAEAACATTGVSSSTPQITWTPNDSTAGYNTSYTASITLTADTGYEFIDSTTAAVSGNTASSVNVNEDGTLTVTYVFSATHKRKIDSVTAPAVPADNTFTTYYGYDGYGASPISVSNSELGTTATVTFEGTVAPVTEAMDVIWTIANDNGADYDRTVEAENTFRWTIPASALTNYDASACQGYDAVTGTITGTVTITNKTARLVTITGTDSSVNYTGAAIDVSQYFKIDTNAGTASYSLVTGADGITGEGLLSGTVLTVAKTGTFKIKVETLADGIYASGEKTITLTVNNGTIEYKAADYAGTYDGQAHSISVTAPEGASVTYSTDGVSYGNDTLSFTDAGIYTVYYRITKANYDTVNGSKDVTINKKTVTITAAGQNIFWGENIAQDDYTVSQGGLTAGDCITEITLIPSTASFTENGTISISNVKIKNTAGADVTGSYEIIPVNGTLKISHDTTLPLDRIEAVKTKNTCTAGESLNVDDITVTAYYADSYSEPVTDFTTNADSIDMQTAGTKTLTVSYTKNGITKTFDISIMVKAAPAPVDYEILDGANSSWEHNSDGSLSIKGNGEFSKFVGVRIDGILIDAENYIVKEGSTIITLKAEYLNTISAGSHTIEIVWTDGAAGTNLTIKTDNDQKEDQNENRNEDPETGDDIPVVWLFILLIISGTELVFTAQKGRKNLKISE